MKSLLLAFLTLFLVKNCNSSRNVSKNSTEIISENTNTLKNTSVQIDDAITYQLINLQNKTVEAHQPTLRILSSQNLLSGDSGCNSYSVSYTKEAERYTFGYPIATKIYCEGSVENDFFKALHDIKFIIEKNDTLVTMNQKRDILFEAVVIGE